MPTTNPLRRRNFVAGLALVGTALVLRCWGPSAHESNVTQDMTQRQHLTALKVPAESLAIRFKAEPREVALIGGFRGESRIVGRDWWALETSDWTFLNGRYATEKCPVLLRDFIEYNAPEQHLPLAELKKVMAAHMDAAFPFSAYVPRFRAAPPGLAKCAGEGLGYDASRGLLTLYGKPVAVMADLRFKESDT